MALEFTGTQNLSFAPIGSDSQRLGLRESGALVGVFKSSTVGSTRMTFWSEIISGDAFLEMFLSLNDGASGAGKVRLYSNTGISIYGGTNLTDGNWHLVVVNRLSATEHYLRIDGQAVGSDLVTSHTTTGVSTSSTRFGMRNGNVSPFTGTLADFAVLPQPLSEADEALLLAAIAGETPSTHIANLSPVAWWTWCEDVPHIIERVGNRRASITIGSPTVVAGPSGRVEPVGLVAATDPSKVHAIAWTTVTILDPDGDRIREVGGVSYHPDDTGQEYKAWYSLSAVPYTGANVGVGYAYATTPLGPWTDAGLVIPPSTLPCEDPKPCIASDGTVYLFVENKTGGTNANGVALFKSTDHGRTFAMVNASIINKGATGAWNATDVSSPVPMIAPDGKGILFVEGRAPGILGAIGAYVFTNIEDAATYRESRFNPLYTGSGNVICDDLLAVDGLNVLTFHDNADGPLDAIAFGSNLRTWVKQFRGVDANNAMTVDANDLHFIVGHPGLGTMVHDVDGYKLKIVQLFGEPAGTDVRWAAAPAGTDYAVTQSYIDTGHRVLLLSVGPGVKTIGPANKGVIL